MMTIVTFVLFIFLMILGWLVLRQPPDERVKLYPFTLILHWIGLIILISFTGFWARILFFSLERPSEFDLLQIVSIAGLVYLGWRRPGIVGWGLVIFGVVAWVVIILGPQPQDASGPLFILFLIATPFLISGLCLVGAAATAAALAREFSSQGKISSRP